MYNVFNNVLRSGRVRGAFDVKGGSIAAGDGHSVICTSEGRVLTFGHCHRGELGHGGHTDEGFHGGGSGGCESDSGCSRSFQHRDLYCRGTAEVLPRVVFGPLGVGITVNSATVVTLMGECLEWWRVSWA